MARRPGRTNVLPGFGPTLGFTLLYLGLVVLIPLSATFFAAGAKGWGHFWETVVSPRVVASYRLSFGVALVAAAVNAVFGLLVAWVLVRYAFPGDRRGEREGQVHERVDQALAGNGWIGGLLAPLGIKVAFTPLGVLVALTFIGLPFVVRTVQPVLEDLDVEVEEAAASLGASRWQTFRRVLLPALGPALLTGFALAFARAVGEYGSVVFISGNLPLKTEITPFLIITKLEQYDYAGAAAVAVAMLVASFALLLTVNLLQAWARRRPAQA